MRKALFVLILALIPSFLWATSPATFVKVQGKVQHLTKPKKKPTGPGPHVLYQGSYYTLKKARRGKKVKNGEIIQTGPESAAKIIFPTGDQFSIGPSTSYKLSWKGKGKKATSQLNLFYGKVRSMISKKGQHKNLKIETQSAVAGVRGTDFYISNKPSKGTQLTVLRGEVAVQPKIKNSKPVSVKKGFSLNIKKHKKRELSSEKKLEKFVQLKPTTKESLVEIQKVSHLKDVPENDESLDPNLAREVKKLEETAARATMEDIRIEDPELHAKLQNSPTQTPEAIDSAVVSKLYKEAPHAKKKKPSLKDVESLGEDVYKKYNKNSK